MTGYLQRLFESANPIMTPVNLGMPALPSQSPVAQYDQRLYTAEPESIVDEVASSVDFSESESMEVHHLNPVQFDFRLATTHQYNTSVTSTSPATEMKSQTHQNFPGKQSNAEVENSQYSDIACNERVDLQRTDQLNTQASQPFIENSTAAPKNSNPLSAENSLPIPELKDNIAIGSTVAPNENERLENVKQIFSNPDIEMSIDPKKISENIVNVVNKNTSQKTNIESDFRLLQQREESLPTLLEPPSIVRIEPDPRMESLSINYIEPTPQLAPEWTPMPIEEVIANTHKTEIQSKKTKLNSEDKPPTSNQPNSTPSSKKPMTAEAASVIGTLPVRRRTATLFGMRRR